jgi:hypothetical protein
MGFVFTAIDTKATDFPLLSGEKETISNTIFVVVYWGNGKISGAHYLI